MSFEEGSMIRRYLFEQNQGIGRNAMSPHASHGKEDLLDALTMARGTILCIFEDDDLVLAFQAKNALIDFAFETIYPLVKEKGTKPARVRAQLGYRFWQKKDVQPEQLEAIRKLLVAEYAGKYKPTLLIAGERLCSPKPQEVGQSACLAGFEFDGFGHQWREHMRVALKSAIRRNLA